MDSGDRARTNLAPAQLGLLDAWLGEWAVVEDLSWPLQDVSVLRIRAAERDLVVKAGRAGTRAASTSHHVIREIAAYDSIPRLPAGRVPTLLHRSAEERLLVTGYLPGELVEGTPAEADPEVYRQAGEILRALMMPAGDSVDYVTALVRKTRALIPRARPLVPASQLDRLDRILDVVTPRAVPLVFTHGDFQPRNWLVDRGQVRVIDFGRADFRHWTSDLPRMQNAQFVARPDLESAFFTGLGRSIGAADRDVHQLESMNQALGTVVWAHDLGDTGFEEQGRRMIDRLTPPG